MRTRSIIPIFKVAANCRLNLILPSLLEALSVCESGICPILHKIRARCETDTGGYPYHEAAVLNALGVNYQSSDGLPVAQCTYLEDFNESPPRHCVRADPVHLQLEREHGKLIPPNALQIQPQQAHQLVADLNAFFGVDCLVVGKDDRWYFTGVDATGLDTVPTDYAADRNISLLLPRSDATRQWRKTATEVQMFLHEHSVNKAREAAGQLPINALWFWGGGKISSGAVTSSSRLFAHSVFAQGLARLLGVTVFPLNEAIPALRGKEHATLTRNYPQITLLDTQILEALNTRSVDEIEQALSSIENHLLAPAVDQLIKGVVSELVLDIGAVQRWRINRWQYMRFWARSPATATSTAVDAS